MTLDDATELIADALVCRGGQWVDEQNPEGYYTVRTFTSGNGEVAMFVQSDTGVAKHFSIVISEYEL